MCAHMWASYVITSIFKTVTISVFNQDMKLHEICCTNQINLNVHIHWKFVDTTLLQKTMSETDGISNMSQVIYCT